jgi:DNA-binding NarL/FixJ family response regulator
MTAPRRSIRVLVVDDHFFTRLGLTAALSMESDITVVAQASNGRQAIDLFSEFEPDVAVLDGNLPDLHGTDVARQIVSRHANAKLLLFSVEETEEAIHRAVHAGVNGYLSKTARRSTVLEAIRTVADGRRYFPDTIQAKLNAHHAHPDLSAREMEVLRHIAHGLSNKEIAEAMGISNETVKTHVGRLMVKLGVQDRAHALMVAMERGILRIN